MKFLSPRFAILFTLVLTAGIPLGAQEPQAEPNAAPAAAAPLLSIDQLSGLLAPIALYPDPLLAQVLAASTYPLEIVEAQQWLLRNRNLAGDQLMQAARQQNWDASVQALVAFPDAMALLSRDIRWTTDVGNAFLAQQQDVMSAIQNLRARAQSGGQLVSGPQQVVNTEQENGQSAIAIEPANPQVMYVPRYSPQAVWGPQFVSPYAYGAPPPAYGAPGYEVGYDGGDGGGIGSGIAGSAIQFGAGVLLNALFSGVTHFTGWGWALNWLVKGLFMNPLFFHNNGFGGYGGYGGGYGGGYAAVAWVHNPIHRMGIDYPTPMLASRFGGSFHGEGYRGQGLRNASYTREPQNFRAQGYRGASSFGAAGNGYRGGYANSTPRQYGQGVGSSARAPQQYGQGFAASNSAPRSYGQGFGSLNRAPQQYGQGSGSSNSAPRQYGQGFASSSLAPRQYGQGFASSASGPRQYGQGLGSSNSPPRQYGQSFSPSNMGNRYAGSNYGNSFSGGRYNAPRSFASSTNSGRNEHYSAPHYSAPKAPHFSAPKAPHFSAPKSHSSGGGHSGGGGHGSKGSKHH